MKLFRRQRKVFEIYFDDVARVWFVVRRCRPGKRLAEEALKEEIVRRGRAIARGAARHGRRSQLVVHNQDGTYAFEHTYPDTTPRAKS